MIDPAVFGKEMGGLIREAQAPVLKRLQDVESSNKDVAELAPQVRTLREEVQALSDKSNSTMSVNELLTRLHHGLKSLRASTHD